MTLVLLKTNISPGSSRFSTSGKVQIGSFLSLDVQQAALLAFRCRVLGDQRFRQFKIKVGQGVGLGCNHG